MRSKKGMQDAIPNFFAAIDGGHFEAKNKENKQTVTSELFSVQYYTL